ncbi:hypothetical protein ACEQPO_02380 [Bacillus sp. SL00103]
MKVICLRAKDGDHLLIVTHHLVIDNCLMPNFTRGLYVSLSAKLTQGQTLVLRPKPLL